MASEVVLLVRPSKFSFINGIICCVCPSPLSSEFHLLVGVIAGAPKEILLISIKMSKVGDLECKNPDKNELQGLRILSFGPL